jgi:polygalacturonase
MDSPELLSLIRIKTSDCRGGVIENVNVRNVKVGKCEEAVLKINLMYEPNENCLRDFPPYVRNVTIENVTSQQSRYGVYIIGLDSTVNVSDVTVSNCSFNGVEQGAIVTGAEKVRLRNVFINGKKIRI